MTNQKVLIVQKIKYGVLVLPVAVLLLSAFGVISAVSPQYEYVPVQDIKAAPSASEIFQVVAYALWALWLLGKILLKVKNHFVIPADLQSGFAFFLGLAIWSFLPLVGMLSVDVAAIIMLVTLLRGQRFGPFTLYHKDVQIEKVS